MESVLLVEIGCYCYYYYNYDLGVWSMPAAFKREASYCIDDILQILQFIQ